MLAINRALSSGCRTALATALGSATGLLVWGITSAIGVAAIFNASAIAFTALKLVGATYLIVVGRQTLRRARHDAAERPHAASAATTDRDRPPRWTFRQGLLTNLLSPKAGVFFIAVLPQFVGAHESILATTLIFAVIDTGISLSALSIYMTPALGRRHVSTPPAARHALDRASGAVLVAFGIRLATTR